MFAQHDPNGLPNWHDDDVQGDDDNQKPADIPSFSHK